MSNDNPAAIPPSITADLEAKIKAMHNFRTAVRSGTFNGAAAPHIAALCNLLDNEHASAVAELEQCKVKS